MKRTKILSLAIIGTLALSGCSPSPSEIPQNVTYTSVEECVKAGVEKTTCDTALASAAANTPKFSTQAQCEAQFGAGQCNSQTSGGSSWFMPALAGFMIGNMLSNSGSSSAYYRGRDDERRRSSYAYTPVYRSASGLSAYSGGKTTPAPATYTASRLSNTYAGSSNSASTSARGGFGSRASASVSS